MFLFVDKVLLLTDGLYIFLVTPENIESLFTDLIELLNMNIHQPIEENKMQ